MSIDTYRRRSRPSMGDYSSVSYLAAPLYPKWSTQSNQVDMAGCQLVNIYPRVQTMKHQRTSPYQARPISYAKCTSCYPYCTTVLEAHPSAFHAQKSPKKSLDASDTLDRSCLSLYYEDRRMCTCHCSFPAFRSPACLDTMYKHEGQTAEQHAHGRPLTGPSPPCFPAGCYRWYLPHNRYTPEDVPIDVRLPTLSKHATSTLLPRDDEKRPAPKRFQCTHCDKSFGKSSHLRDHIRTHTGDRPYRCQYCEKAFTQYSNLRTHTRIHTGEKPYRCRHCNKSFTQAVTLRSHTRTHTGDKPYHCKHCTKSFTCFSGLKGHISIHDVNQENTEIMQIAITPSIKQEKTSDDISAPEHSCKMST